jgi:ABC-2 type transport system ATP-binding protein
VTHSAARRYELEAGRDLRTEAAQAVIACGGRLFSLDLAELSLDEVYTRYFEEVEHDGAS